ncbi:hypothetical protein NNJEOMEG_02827 [Fundidesulfovibrio magnetotacticus]|uniref:DUF362 domain-containing protein n=2 Tax=Fundidesulfovibrio magnetotacticus TaxID=2730080 RepID=A0A6V8LY58_9BACT|nr:hypothetical protein NNJEOMEG_02827 [Fundidesulfovibrio magnetotacticus]
MEGYGRTDLDAVAGRLLELAGCRPAKGTRVLVKPNLVAPAYAGLACTEPAVVRAVCRYLLDRGARVTVGDSPAFGTARIVARACGLDKALRGLGVPVVNFSRARPVALTLGGQVMAASQALDAEFIVNVPRFKVHDQMLLTLAVKNFFGAVTGFRKSLAHQVHGEKGNRFESMLLDVCLAMPPSVSLVDGVTAMHVRGPAKGEPFQLGLLGAAADPVALDQTLHAVLGLPPEATPLGREAGRRGLLGPVETPLRQPGDFDARGFVLPGKLAPVAFDAGRFVRGRLRSLWLRLTCGRAS